jgi:hypothetical protein
MSASPSSAACLACGDELLEQEAKIAMNAAIDKQKSAVTTV